MRRSADVSSPEPGVAALPEAVDHLREGGLLAYPTETVYGLGCLLRDAPLRRLAILKRGGEAGPFLLLIRDLEMAMGLRWNDRAEKLAKEFWPGALTLLLEDPDSRFPAQVRGAEGTVAVRQSPHPTVRKLLGRLDEPLTSTSANLPAEPPALSVSEVRKVIREMGAGDEFTIVDGGTLPPSDPSTLVDCTGPVPVVRREGAVSRDRLHSVMPEIE